MRGHFVYSPNVFCCPAVNCHIHAVLGILAQLQQSGSCLAHRVFLFGLHHWRSIYCDCLGRNHGFVRMDGVRFYPPIARGGYAGDGFCISWRAGMEFREHTHGKRDRHRGPGRGLPGWLLAAVIVLTAAAFTNAAAYRNLGQSSGSTSKTKGIVLSLAAGVLVGIFPPLVGRAISGPHALDSYNVSIFFTFGALLAALSALPILLAKPLVGTVGSASGYLQGKPIWHLAGLIAGTVWCIGTVANFVSAGVVGVAVSWGIGNGAPVIGALWGIFLWKEFKNGGSKAKTLIALSMALYVAGVVAVAISYQVR
jgi:hypothetical protein